MMRSTRHVVRMALLAVVLLASCSKDGGTGPSDSHSDASTPARVLVTPTADTLNWISATKQFSASVLSSTGLALPTPLTWYSSATPVATVSSSGLVTAVGVGTTTITASAGSVSGSAAVVVRQLPATITKVSGDSQSGTVGRTLAQPLVVEVRDQGNAAVAGAVLGWSVSAGGGTLVSASTETDAAGHGQGTWRLGLTVGGQSVRVSSGEASPVTFSATAMAPDVARVDLAPAVDTLRAVGDTARFTAVAYASDGSAITEASISYATTDTTVATISSTGLATARAAGTTKVVAQSSTKADSSSLVVILPPPSPVTITGVTPAVFIEEQTATIQGGGFSTTPSNNVVSLGGLSASVTAASSTSLTITVPRADCQPPRKAVLAVTFNGNSASRTVGVTPIAQSDLDLPVAYYRWTRGGIGCLQLPGYSAGAQYIIGVVSTSEAPSSLTGVSLTGTPGDATVLGLSPTGVVAQSSTGAEILGDVTAGEPLPAPSFVPSPIPAATGLRENVVQHSTAEAVITAQNLALRAALGPSGEAPHPARSPVRPVAAGDVLTMETGFSRSCASGTQVQATVRYVGNSTIWLEDNANPSGTFTDSELASLDAFYSSNAKPVHDVYFGGLSDVNGDGRIYILMTKEVNKVTGFAGWVWWADLYPTTTCSTSNHAEVFFGEVPDPDGVVGSAHTKQQLLDYYPLLLTHEITHLVQANAAVFGSAGAKATWELEGGAQLAVQLAAYRLFDQGSGQDLGYAQYQAGQYWYWNSWLAHVFEYFGWNSDTGTGKVSSAPEECSWLGTSAEGNNEPCKGGHVYGVPPMVLRFALDRWGGSYAGGEQGLMKRLTTSPYSGWASLTDISGWPIEQILAEFYAALWADGRLYNAYGMTSWNLDDVFTHFAADRQLQPHTSSAVSPQMSVNIRGGSNAYLYWTPAGSLAPTAIKVTSLSGGGIATTIAVWALRVK